jgi:hypothetical protein
VSHNEPEDGNGGQDRKEAGKDQPDSYTEGSEASNKCDPKQIIAALHCIKQELNRSNDENSPQKKCDRRWERGGIVGLWFAAIVGLIAVCVSSRDAEEQRGAMNQQLTAMIGSQRAYVFLSALEIRFSIEEPGKYALATTFTNGGETASRELTIKIGCVSWPEPLGEPWDHVAWQDPIKRVIGPKSPVDGPYCMPLLDQNFIEKLTKKTIHYYAAGAATYFDGLDKAQRTTEFSYELTTMRQFKDLPNFDSRFDRNSMLSVSKQMLTHNSAN